MANKPNKFTIRKFDVDSDTSWAVFTKEDVQGIRGVVPWGDAPPIFWGLSRCEAERHRIRCDAK